MHLQGTLCRYKNIYFSYNRSIFFPKIYMSGSLWLYIYYYIYIFASQPRKPLTTKCYVIICLFFANSIYVTFRKKKIKEHNNCRNYIDLKKYIIEFAYTGKIFVPVVLVFTKPTGNLICIFLTVWSYNEVDIFIVNTFFLFVFLSLRITLIIINNWNHFKTSTK